MQKGTLLFFTTILLVILGVLFVFEASVAESFRTFGDQYYLLKQHAIGVGAGFLGLLAGMLIPAKWWVRFSLPLFVVSLLLLAAVFVPGLGLELNGARRWILLGPVVFQPVELLKFALVGYFASWLSRHQRLLPFLFLLGVPSLLLLLQPDLGSLLLVIGIAMGLYFLSGGELKKIGLLAAIGIPLVLVLILGSDYRRERLQTFLNPDLDPQGSSFHIRQITLALGRGGLTGQGIGNSSQKFSYIPEASTDSIFAIVAEEVGFVGSTFIFAIFLLHFTLMYRIISQPMLPKGVRLLGYGILLWVAGQTILNLAAVVGLVPLTGIPLPYFSYGRSALIMILLATGILIRISREQ